MARYSPDRFADQLAGITIRRTQLRSPESAIQEHLDGSCALFLPEGYRGLFEHSFGRELDRDEWVLDAKGGGLCTLANPTALQMEAVREFLQVMSGTVFITERPPVFERGALALSLNMHITDRINYEYTELGSLVRRAKPYGKRVAASHQRATRVLANKLLDFIKRNPAWSDKFDAIVGAPPSDPGAYSVSRELAAMLAAGLGIDDLSRHVRNKRRVPGAKTLDVYEKVQRLAQNLWVDEGPVRDRRVLVVDDLYQSGASVNAIGLRLRRAGASAFAALAVVKTLRDDDNVSEASTRMLKDPTPDEKWFLSFDPYLWGAARCTRYLVKQREAARRYLSGDLTDNPELFEFYASIRDDDPIFED